MSRRTLLVISQTYRPDPAAVGQYIADTAEEMAHRGWKVLVYTADRGYDDPTIRFPSRETIEGVEIRRIPFSSWGKGSIFWRMLGGMLFVGQTILRGLLSGRLDALLVSTSPPLAPLAAIVLRLLRGPRILYWVMDLNPDQYVALGHAPPDAFVVRLFDAMNRAILRASSAVVVLDRFMAKRVQAKVDVADRILVLPPWSRADHLDPVAHGDNPFRARHGLGDKFVVMYSGNHGPSNPLSTLIASARALASDDRFVFAFIGGGVGKREVDEAAAGSANILSLPYQPMEELRFSLSAADIHAVTIGDEVIGIVHPSKVYGAFAVERPVLLVGPRESHIGDMISEHGVGWHAVHGDVDGIVTLLTSLADARRAEVSVAGRRAKSAAEVSFSMARLRGALCDRLESLRR